MIKLFLDFFFPKENVSGTWTRQPSWLRLACGLYILLGLFSFGHNYVNYPVYDKRWVAVIKPGDYYDRTVDRIEERETSIMFTGMKATMAGIFWPAYGMVLLNERIAA